MTKEELEQYHKLKKEIAYLEKRIETQEKKRADSPEIAGTVQASSASFPYIPYRVTVQMTDPKVNDAVKKTLAILEARLEKCNEELLKIERFIDRIKDSELRQIFELRYIEGKKLREIAEELNEDRSGIGKKITEYLRKNRK